MNKALLILSLCLIGGAAIAQVAPEFESGSIGLLFSFAGLDNLSANSFNGGIGGKYYLSSTTAFRAGLQFMTAKREIPANPPAGFAGQDGEISGSTFGLNGALEFHRGSERVSPYLGFGLGLSTTSTENKERNIGPPSGQRVTKNDPQGENINGIQFLAGTQLDVFGMLGAEFFIAKELSLAAEYRLGFSKLSGKDAESTEGTTATKLKTGSTSGFGIATAGVLTLAVYF